MVSAKLVSSQVINKLLELMMADMPQAMAVLRVIKALILYFPSTLRSVIQDPAADLL